MTGILYGIGIGPGDPSLVTFGAKEILEKADRICIPVKKKGEESKAFEIVKQVISIRKEQTIEEVVFAMKKDRKEQEKGWNEAKEQIKNYLDQGEDIAIITLGDVSIYSTAFYVCERIKQMGYEVKFQAGVPSFCAGASLLGISLVEGRESLTVIPAIVDEEHLREKIQLSDQIVLMKAGNKIKEIRHFVEQEGNITAYVLSNIGLEGEYIGKLDGNREYGYLTTVILKKEKKKAPIVVIAGTTESHCIIRQLLEQGERVIATTATSLGSEMLEKYPIEIKEGKLDQEGFSQFFAQVKPKKVIDTSHPYAVIVSQNVQEVCKKLKIAYEQIKREETNYCYENVIEVESIEEAIFYLNETFMSENILLTTGSNTLEQYVKEVKNSEKRLYGRVIDHEYAKNLCQNIPIGQDHILYKSPPFTKEDTKQILLQYHCTVLVTKDSGKEGGTEEKIELAKELGISVILIKRPSKVVEKRRKGLLICGSGSGSGKTTVTCGLMSAFARRNVDIMPFKCGPDYIDPMLHKAITGKTSYNLDGFFMNENVIKEVYQKNGTDQSISIVEGVMGFYDGIGMTTKASSYDIANILQLDTVLVLSVKGMATTLCAILQGILTYRENRIIGIILNQCTKGLYEKLKVQIEEQFPIKVFGYLPVCEEVQIKERHLGLYTAEEIPDLQKKMEKLSSFVEEHINLPELLSAIEDTPYIEYEKSKKIWSEQEKVVVGVAKDEAFCFCYDDNLAYLEEQGAEIVFFSPLYDKQLPQNIDALYLTGGYPELYGKRLEDNISMKESIQYAIEREHIPVIAECGGYAYLCQTLQVDEHNSYKMVGVIEQEIQMTNRLNMQFGYVMMTAIQDGLLGKKGDQFACHEFHYSKEKIEKTDFYMEKYDKSRSWNGGVHTETMYAGYGHFHFRSEQKAIKHFLQKASQKKG